jgi:hypothetical protein
MASTPEGVVKARVKNVLEKHGAYVFMPVQSGFGAPSLDFVIFHRGRGAAVETKAGSKDMTPRQKLTADEMRKAGAAVFLINDYTGLDELEGWLNEH